MTWGDWAHTSEIRCQEPATRDEWSGTEVAGEEYTVDGTWQVSEAVAPILGGDGKEFVPRHTVFTNDPKPKYLHKIKIGDEWETVMAVQSWDRSMFGEPPTYKLETV